LKAFSESEIIFSSKYTDVFQDTFISSKRKWLSKSPELIYIKSKLSKGKGAILFSDNAFVLLRCVNLLF